MHQTSTSKSIVRIAVFACAACYAFGQTPTVIQIDIENYAAYYADNPDYSKLASSQNAVAPVSTNTFASFSGLADIARVNGEPAKGTCSVRGTITNYTPTPQPGQAIADTTRQVTPDVIFRGPTPGDLTGPYLSQFLLKPVQTGATTLTQLYRTSVVGDDY